MVHSGQKLFDFPLALVLALTSSFARSSRYAELSFLITVVVALTSVATRFRSVLASANEVFKEGISFNKLWEWVLVLSTASLIKFKLWLIESPRVSWRPVGLS